MKRNEPEVKSLFKLVQSNRISEALECYRKCLDRSADPPGLTLAFAEALLKGKQVDLAEQLLEAELRRDPERFELLVLLGMVDQNKGQNLSAMELYIKADRLAETKAQHKQVYVLLTEVKKQVKGKATTYPHSFTLQISGNRRPMELEYDLQGLKARRELLEALLKEIDPRAKTVLEIEIDAGTVGNSLVDHGFEVEGTSEKMDSIMLALSFKYQEALRKAGMAYPSYYQVMVDNHMATGFKKRDVIMLLPVSCEWYLKRGLAESAEIISTLFKRSKRQLFFYIPPSKKGETDTVTGGLLDELNTIDGFADQAIPVDFNKECGLLFLLKQRQANPGRIDQVLPSGLAAEGSRSHIFEVELDLCRSENGFSYNKEGWNHFNAYLEEFTANEDIEYSQSILKKFFDSFQPTNRHEQLFGTGPGGPPINQGWTVYPWQSAKNLQLNTLEIDRPRGGIHHFGPNSEQFGADECQKLRNAYILIASNGYRPEIFPDGYIQGIILKDGVDYRFIVSEGQHRMSAIGFLGYKAIKCKFDPWELPVVDIKKVRQWPQVQSGLYDINVAKKVFRYYFEEDGRRKAQELGLLN